MHSNHSHPYPEERQELAVGFICECVTATFRVKYLASGSMIFVHYYITWRQIAKFKNHCLWRLHSSRHDVPQAARDGMTGEHTEALAPHTTTRTYLRIDLASLIQG